MTYAGICYVFYISRISSKIGTYRQGKYVVRDDLVALFFQLKLIYSVDCSKKKKNFCFKSFQSC